LRLFDGVDKERNPSNPPTIQVLKISVGSDNINNVIIIMLLLLLLMMMMLMMIMFN